MEEDYRGKARIETFPAGREATGAPPRLPPPSPPPQPHMGVVFGLAWFSLV